ncbi:Serine/threonine-protein kinase PrkC [Planctomycetales bacterium 10988]|nr:Serine/threonine-protein kinase PrkC [Planctomycetales bacterium 10988]
MANKTSPPDPQTFEALLLRSGLIEEDRLPTVRKRMRKDLSGEEPNTKRMAQWLLNEGFITPWQNEKLMQGRHRGFFLGNYKLLGHISKGGMSEVYLAEQVNLRRRVAIKIFPPSLIEKSSYLERFYRESRTQAALDHPNIVKAHDFGHEGKIHYLVMEYIDGHDLLQLVKKEGPLSYRRATEYILQTAKALEYAHQQGMIHRDMKPANLMLDGGGKIKLLDLGLARILDGEEGSLTLKHNENTLGTADYVAPEQTIDSHHVDERADIYSLGGTFYFLLTGHPPFPEGTSVQRMMMHLKEEPADIREKRPDCPESLTSIISKMMAKKPEKRYQTAEELAEVLENWIEEDREKRNTDRPSSKGSSDGGDLASRLASEMAFMEHSNDDDTQNQVFEGISITTSEPISIEQSPPSMSQIAFAGVDPTKAAIEIGYSIAIGACASLATSYWYGTPLVMALVWGIWLGFLFSVGRILTWIFLK